MRNGFKDYAAAKVFIAHARNDTSFVRALAKQLDSLGLETATSPDDRGAKAGKRLRDAVTNSSFVLAVLSDRSLESPMVNFEIGVALGQDKKIVPLYLSSKTMRSGAARPFKYLQGVDIERQSPAQAAKSVAAIIAQSSLDPRPSELQKFWRALRSSSGALELD